MTQRIGIFGGMFDPVHAGHLHAARLAWQQGALDRVHMLPCGQPVHRNQALTSCAHRAAMLQLVTQQLDWLQVDLRECDQQAPSRSYDTLLSFRKEFPSAALFLVMGLDSLLQLSGWYRWRDLFGLAHLLVIARPGFVLSSATAGTELWQVLEPRLQEPDQAIVDRQAGRVQLLELEPVAVSSTRVRQLLADRQNCDGMLEPEILAYIRQHNLYDIGSKH